MQKTNALNWLFPEKVRRVKKQSTKTGRFLLGYVPKNFQRDPSEQNLKKLRMFLLAPSVQHKHFPSEHLGPGSLGCILGSAFPLAVCTSWCFPPCSHHLFLFFPLYYNPFYCTTVPTLWHIALPHRTPTQRDNHSNCSLITLAVTDEIPWQQGWISHPQTRCLALGSQY